MAAGATWPAAGRACGQLVTDLRGPDVTIPIPELPELPSCLASCPSCLAYAQALATLVEAIHLSSQLLVEGLEEELADERASSSAIPWLDVAWVPGDGRGAPA